MRRRILSLFTPLSAVLCVFLVLITSCGRATVEEPAATAVDDRQYLLERIGDAAVVQLYADGFVSLPLREKTLIYHLYQAAIAGRDIFIDQRYEHSLAMRDVLEEILTHSADIDPEVRTGIEHYTKLFWINNGPYNTLSSRKFVLGVNSDDFGAAVMNAARHGAVFPLRGGRRSGYHAGTYGTVVLRSQL